MNQKIYQIDAFADKVFSGNPAAVCPLAAWPGEEVLQNIAMENNLAETAFYVQKDDQFEIRWFTPTVEVDLCGHATLASAYVLFFLDNYKDDIITFFSPRSGKLTVTRNEDLLTLNFPADVLEAVPISNELERCFNIKALAAYKGKTDYMLVFENETAVSEARPDLNEIAKVDARGIIITAEGDTVDFVSRFFAPQSGVNEDPVTGSAHTTLTPYWSRKLNKKELTAIQLSGRRGHLQCRYLDERVEISGNCSLYMRGEIFI